MHHAQEIFVTNHNKFVHEDAFDGVVYVFPPEERVVVPAAAATHMLGFNVPDKTDALTRLGWAWTIKKGKDGKGEITEDPEGVKKLANFEFTKATLAPMEHDPVAM